MQTVFADVPAAPKELVSGGKFNLGRFSSPFSLINPLDVALGAPRFWKNFRLKEWQHFALVSSDYYLSLALFNAKALALAQVCIQDVRSKAIYFYERMTPPWAFKVPADLSDSSFGYKSQGFAVAFENKLSENKHHISFNISAQKGLPAVSGDFTIFDAASRHAPMEVCLPLIGKRAMYSHKNICPLAGSMTLDGAEIPFAAESSYALADIHKGYYPYRMKWHWATAGKVEEGRLLGFNLTNNQVQDQATYNENCLWLDGALHSLPPVTFAFNQKDILKPWHIAGSGEAGEVNLTFTPEVVRKVDINAILIANRYRGPFGLFSGHVFLPKAGIDLELKDFRGMCENFYLRC